MPLNITKEIATLNRMRVGQLKEKYAAIFGEAARSGNRQWLIKRFAWRLQANEEGDLSERARRRALELANDADLRVTAPKATSGEANGHTVTSTVNGDPRLPMPGTILTRHYKGRTLLVTVLPNGFEYEGERYRSLSADAKTITGSHWSGHRFFGIQNGGAK